MRLVDQREIPSNCVVRPRDADEGFQEADKVLSLLWVDLAQDWAAVHPGSLMVISIWRMRRKRCGWTFTGRCVAGLASGKLISLSGRQVQSRPDLAPTAIEITSSSIRNRSRSRIGRSES